MNDDPKDILLNLIEQKLEIAQEALASAQREIAAHKHKQRQKDTDTDTYGGLITPPAAAVRAGVSVRTIFRWASEGLVGTAWRHGRRWVSASDVDAIVEARRDGPIRRAQKGETR